MPRNILKGFNMNLFETENITKIFGNEDAANENIERLKEFFFKRGDYLAVKSELPLTIVVGFKGVGKSAILKIAYEEDREENKPTIWIRPDDIIEMVDELSSNITDFSKMVLLWKRGIAKLIASRIASDWLFVCGDDAKSALMWAQEAGYRSRDFVQKTISLLQPQIVKSVDTESTKAPFSRGEHHILERLMSDQKIVLYFDDLDAGWEATKDQKTKLSALILALRNMTTDIPGLKARLALRTDVYTLLRESDESTDKFENYVINCNWQNHDILILLVKRILTFFGDSMDDAVLSKKTPAELNQLLSKIMDIQFRNTTAWKNKSTHKVIMSLIRSRPRDMIKLCTLAAKAAYAENPESTIIKDINFEKILDDYSFNRVQDIINEFKYEMLNLKTLLYRMAPTTDEIKTKKTNTYVYTTTELLTKIKNIQSNSKLTLVNKNVTETIDIAHFLYKIGFITARKMIDGKIDRKYYDEKKQLLQNGAIGDGGFSWEIHPSYRSAISTSQKTAWMNTLDFDEIS